MLHAFNTHNGEKHLADIGSVAVARNEESVSKAEVLRDVMEVKKADDGKDRWHVKTQESRTGNTSDIRKELSREGRI